MEELFGAEVMYHHFKDGSSSIVMPKAVVRKAWHSAADQALKLTPGQFVGILDLVPGRNYFLGVVASFNDADQASVRGISIRGRVGFFPKDVVHMFAPVTIHYSPRTFKLKVTYTYWPWNRYGVLLSSSAISYGNSYTVK